MLSARSEIAALNSFLCKELAVIEQYTELLAEVPGLGSLHKSLHRCRASHCERAGELRRRVYRLGGYPIEFGRAVASSALTSARWSEAARCDHRIDTVQQAELDLLLDYHFATMESIGQLLCLVEDTLLPAQEQVARESRQLC